jgi:ribosome-binding protein aMBF1 (putative translation factor)
MLRAKRTLTPYLTAAILTVGGSCAVPASMAHAQSQTPGAQSETPGAQSQTPGLPGQTKNVSDEKLDAAAAAIKQLAAVRDDYEQRIKDAKPDDQERLAEEAKTALAKAITDQGLSVPEYSSIIVIARNDPEVQEKLLQRLGSPGK